MAPYAWPLVVLILGCLSIYLAASTLVDFIRQERKNQRDIAELRKQTELELVAAKKLVLDISGALESRIRDLEMKVN